MKKSMKDAIVKRIVEVHNMKVDQGESGRMLIFAPDAVQFACVSRCTGEVGSWFLRVHPLKINEAFVREYFRGELF